MKSSKDWLVLVDFVVENIFTFIQFSLKVFLDWENATKMLE